MRCGTFGPKRKDPTRAWSALRGWRSSKSSTTRLMTRDTGRRTLLISAPVLPKRLVLRRHDDSGREVASSNDRLARHPQWAVQGSRAARDLESREAVGSDTVNLVENERTGSSQFRMSVYF